MVCLSRYEPPDPQLRPEEVRDRANGDWYLRQSESTDGGRTWSEAQKTPIWGYPPHLLRLHNEDMLVTYGHRRPPYGQRACLSHDGGRTWDIDNEIVLRDDAAPPGRDLGYPATVELGQMSFSRCTISLKRRGRSLVSRPPVGRSRSVASAADGRRSDGSRRS